MNVLLVRPRLTLSGATGYLVQLANGLVERGHDVVVASGPGAMAADLDERVTHYADLDMEPRRFRLPNALGYTNAVARLARITRRHRIDVVNTHHRYASLAARATGPLTRVPIVSTMHELHLDSRRITRFGLGRLVIAPSASLEHDLVTHYGIPTSRIRVVHFGMPAPPLPTDAERAEARRELETPDVPLIGCIASLVPRKGHRFLFDALPALAATTEFHLILVGTGPEQSALERQAEQLGVRDRITFLGRRHDISRILAALDVSVLPSLDEVLPLAVVESMASGVPVVATSVAGVPEAVEDGSTGYLVPPQDPPAMAEALAHLLSDRAAAERMGRAGREVMQDRFSRERWLSTTESVFRDAVASA